MLGRKCLPLLVVLPVAALASPLLALRTLSAVQGQSAPTPALVVIPLKSSAHYARGERAGWVLSLPSVEGGASVGGTWKYTLRRNGSVILDSGTVSPGQGARTVAVTLNEPAMLLLRIEPAEPAGTVPAAKPLTYGAAIDPAGLRRVETRPKDFDAFWTRKLAELRRIPENAVITPGKSPLEGVEYGTIRMDHVNGTHVYGQIARPERKPGEESKRYPAILQMQWASPPYPLDPWWIVNRAKQGFLVLNIEPHDVLPTEPPAYYAALPDALKNYNTIGQDDRERSYFVEMYLRDVRGAEYLTHRPDWNGQVLIATGGSMGGQQSLAVAALFPRITHVIAEEPAGCDLAAPLHGRAIGYPFFDPSNSKIMATARYVDNVNFAPRIRAKTLVGMGYVDEICPPAGIWTALNLVRGPKEAAPLPEATHNNTATPEQMRPFRARAEEWFAALAKGRDVTPQGTKSVMGR